MKALVTGGAGFIGSYVVEQLIAEGNTVTVIDNFRTGRLSNLKNYENHPQLQIVRADIRDYESLVPYFKGIDWVFHLAALADIVPSIEDPRTYFDVNVTGTLNVLECARLANVKRLIYTASSSCYGMATSFPTPESAPISPQYPYALTKYLGEELTLHWGKVYHLPVISLRLFNVYGPRGRTAGTYGAVFGVFLTQKLHGYPFTVVGDGTQTRDFTFATDVANAFICAAKSEVTGEIFNVGSSTHNSINRLVELLGGHVTYIPKRPGEPDCTFADISKIEKSLGWKAKVSFEEGVSRLLKSIADYRDAPLWEPKTIEKATEKWFHYLSEDQKTCS